MNAQNRRNDFVVVLERPGIDARDIDVVIEQGHLIVTEAREQSSEPKEGEQSYTERWVMHCPASVDLDETTASLKEGLLTVTLPKSKKELSTRRASYKKVTLERK